MHDRHKNDIGRRSVLDGEQVVDQPAPNGTVQSPRQNRGGGWRKLIPVVLLGAVAVLIAHEEIPAFADWWERAFFPQRWQIRQTCQQAALTRSAKPDYSRVVKPGDVHATANGTYVDKLVLGEMGQDGLEHKVEYTCYLDASGLLIKLNRVGKKAPDAGESEIHLSPTSVRLQGG